MSQTNGTPVEITRDDLLQARRRLRLTEANLRQAKLDHVTKLQESISLPDMWLNASWDMLGRNNADVDFSGFRRTNRKDGRNYPIFENEEQLGNIREMSRILAAHNGYAKGLIQGLVSYVDGNGFDYRVTSKDDAPDELVDACQDILEEFLERSQWHGGEMPSLEEELIRRAYIDGEFFAATYLLDGGLTDVRSIEPELVTAPAGKDAVDWMFGIFAEPQDIQKHLAYWVGWQGRQATDGQEFTPAQMTHLRRNVVRSIKRGLPDLYGDTLNSLHTASSLRRNMAEGAAIQASYAGIRQHDTATRSEVEDFRSEVADYTSTHIPSRSRLDYHQKFEPGMVDIPKGLNFVQPPTATNAAAHVEILQACLRAGGVWCNAPEWLVSGLHDTSSFASSLTAESPFLRLIVRDQRSFKSAFMRIMWTVLQNCCKAKPLIVRMVVLDADGTDTGQRTERAFAWSEVERLIEITVEAPNPETRDKAAEAAANQTYMVARVKSPQTVMQELGLDVEQELVNQEEFQERLGDAGLPLPLPPDTYGKEPAADPAQVGDVADTAGQAMGGCGGPGVPPGPCPSGIAASTGGVVVPRSGKSRGGDLFSRTRADPYHSGKGDGGCDGSDVDSIIGLQTAYYAGTLPREAAIASATLLHGLTPEDAAQLFPERVPVVESTVQASKLYEAIMSRMRLPDVPPPPVNNITVNVPKQDPAPAPTVHAAITLQEAETAQLPPTINITVPPGPAPVVQVDNHITVPPGPAPVVTVQPAPVVIQPSPAPAKKGKRRVSFGKDSAGKITDATIEDS